MMMQHFSTRLFSILCLLAMFSACSKDKPIEDTIPAAEVLYEEGTVAIQNKNYETAEEKLLAIEKNYPYSPLANKGQVMAAYAYYRDQEYDDAVDLIDKFVKVNPGYKDTPYMYYLKALSYYERIADVRRDQKVTELAQAALKEVALRYPDSEYAKDAKLKLDLVTDHLAGKQMEIGRFYLKKGNYIAAINRFKDVVEHYDTTSHVAEALYRLTETYLAMGVRGEAQKYAAVLGHNYPGSRWYDYAYNLVEKGATEPVKTKPSWFAKTFTFEQKEDAPSCDLEDGSCSGNPPGWFDKLGDWF